MIRNILIIFSAIVNLIIVISAIVLMSGCSANIKATDFESGVEIQNPFGNASSSTARV